MTERTVTVNTLVYVEMNSLVAFEHYTEVAGDNAGDVRGNICGGYLWLHAERCMYLTGDEKARGKAIVVALNYARLY